MRDSDYVFRGEFMEKVWDVKRMKRMKRMLDGAKVLRGIRKEGVSPEAFLVHVVVSSPELIDLKSKGFGKFSVNPASSGLFWRFGAGCAIAHKAKEKPLESC